MMSMNDIKKRLAAVADSSISREWRVFARLEAVFMPVSFLTRPLNNSTKGEK